MNDARFSQGALRTPPALSPEQIAEAVDWAVGSRLSVRGFTDAPVSMETVKHILALASRAPSGTNMQPWKVTVVTGAAKERLSKALLAAHDDPERRLHGGEYKYYPDSFPEPYLSRRRKVGWDLYGLIGIAKGEKERMHAQHGRNFLFFDAPVGMIVTIDRVLEIGSWLDLGMFLQNILIAARGQGLATCPQAAFAFLHKAIRQAVPIPEEEVVVCGIALGHADESLPENGLQTLREPVENFTRFIRD